MIDVFYNWLHGNWPEGLVEKLPVVGEDGRTNRSFLRIVGDLSGVPLLKYSSETGSRAVRAILEEPEFQAQRGDGRDYDIAIIGAGVSGLSAAMEAKKAGLSYVVYESSRTFNTVENFPKGKPIFTYPTAMTPQGGIQYDETMSKKESLLEGMKQQIDDAGIDIKEAQVTHVEQQRDGVIVHQKNAEVVRVSRCIIAIGRSGNYRTLNIPGENLDKVMNRLHDPADFAGKTVLIVGGGDSAVEAALALEEHGADVSLSYRKNELTRPKPENVQRLTERAEERAISLELGTQPTKVDANQVWLKRGNEEIAKDNDYVFSLIGREAPLDFFRRSGITISGERTMKWWVTAALSALFFCFLYQWKKGGTWLKINEFWRENTLFPFGLDQWLSSLGAKFNDSSHLFGALKYVIGDPGFWYSTAYCFIIVVFGLRRVQRRKTPYVKRQTLTLALIQIIPLFLLPYIVLPWAGFNGAFDEGVGKWIADQLFPIVNYGSGREYWRAFGLILAWPLFFWNVFTDQPMWLWLGISMVQTFVIIPLIVRRWGKGAYCGWICSCGALAETLGDAHRHKMPHGPFWNRANMIGQIFLALAVLIFISRLLAWMHVPGFKAAYDILLYGTSAGATQPWSYVWFVDLLWAGVIGVAFYFHLSGRVWCRFACPLAALMHLYARFGKFRIFADKKKCISCNVCTSVCHQGIDVMSFANKGKPMEDPQCVRCSACVQQCPTGVLQFGRLGKSGDPVYDGLKASSANPEGNSD